MVFYVGYFIYLYRIGYFLNTPFQALEACIVFMTADYHDVLMGVSPAKMAVSPAKMAKAVGR